MSYSSGVSSVRRFNESLVAVFLLSLSACGGRRAETAAPSPAASPAVVEVPAPAGHDEPAASRGPAPPRAERRAPAESEGETFDVDIESDGGTLHVASVGDGGVRVWGKLTRSDGGFSFQGGFTVGQPLGDGGP
jgi:hypothetical protein